AKGELHEALDLWGATVVKAHWRSAAPGGHSADDGGCACRSQDDAERKPYPLLGAPEQPHVRRWSRVPPACSGASPCGAARALGRPSGTAWPASGGVPRARSGKPPAHGGPPGARPTGPISGPAASGCRRAYGATITMTAY